MGCRHCGCHVAFPKWQYHVEKPQSLRKTVYWSFACNTCVFLQDLQRFRLDNPQSRDVIERHLAEDMEVFANVFSQDTDCTLANYRTVSDVPGQKEYKYMNKTMRAQRPWYSSGYKEDGISLKAFISNVDKNRTWKDVFVSFSPRGTGCLVDGTLHETESTVVANDAIGVLPAATVGGLAHSYNGRPDA